MLLISGYFAHHFNCAIHLKHYTPHLSLHNVVWTTTNVSRTQCIVQFQWSGLCFPVGIYVQIFAKYQSLPWTTFLVCGMKNLLGMVQGLSSSVLNLVQHFHFTCTIYSINIRSLIQQQCYNIFFTGAASYYQRCPFRIVHNINLKLRQKTCLTLINMGAKVKHGTSI